MSDYISRERIENEISLVKPKWDKYLEGLDDYKAGTLAIILENQRLFNEVSNSQGALKERSIDIVARIYREFIGFEVVSIQPLLGPVGLVYFHKFEYEKDPITNENVVRDGLPVINRNITHEDIAAKTRILHARQPLEWTEDNTEAFVQQVREEITREIFTDLRNNAGTVIDITTDDLKADTIYSRIMQISGVIHRKTLVGDGSFYWVVTNPTIGKLMASHMGNGTSEKIEEAYGKKTIINVGHMGMRWKLIVDSLYPDNQILIGAFPRPLDSGYNYCPYIALGNLEGGVITRYGKKLLREGAKYYGVINFKEKEEKKDE